MIRRTLAGGFVMIVLAAGHPRKVKAEDAIASKVLYYMEDNERIKVVAPTFLFQRETGDGWTIKIDGIYNAISGATPTGAPAVQAAPAAGPKVRYYAPASEYEDVEDDGEDDDVEQGDGEDDEVEQDDGENEDKDGVEGWMSDRSSSAVGADRVSQSQSARKFHAKSGASSAPSRPRSTRSSRSSSSRASTATAPVPASRSAEIPMSDFSDDRIGLNLGISRKIGRHTPGAQISYSTETDYVSTGLSLQDLIDFNRKNTTLLIGTAYTHDSITPANETPEDTKRTVDLIVGLTQVLSPTTLFTVNLSLGETSGLLSDPYKVVEMNGKIVPEVRPDSKDKQILFLELNQFIKPLNGALDLSLRHYQDSFGINAETLTAEWQQKIGKHFILAPMIRYYDQTEADFYAVRFSGSPDAYSSDYRISAFNALGYGLKLVWLPSSRVTMDIGMELYDQKGSDGVTQDEMYPSATLVTAGIKWTL